MNFCSYKGKMNSWTMPREDFCSDGIRSAKGLCENLEEEIDGLKKKIVRLKTNSEDWHGGSASEAPLKQREGPWRLARRRD